MCLLLREEVWLERISHFVGFYPAQPDGSFSFALCCVEGALTESCSFLEAGGSGRGGRVSVLALPSWGTRRHWAIPCGLRMWGLERGLVHAHEHTQLVGMTGSLFEI